MTGSIPPARRSLWQGDACSHRSSATVILPSVWWREAGLRRGRMLPGGLLGVLVALVWGAAAACLALPAMAEQAKSESAAGLENAGVRFLRIGTGPTSGTYFPVGGLIANAVSSPPGARPCDRGGSCGVPGVIAVAQSTLGSVANLESLGRSEIDMAISQTDVAFWAFTGGGLYKGTAPQQQLRSLGYLYQEAFHLVVRKGSGINSIRDLKGKRVAVGEEGSGSLVESTMILEAYGVSLKKKQFTPLYMKPGQAADALLKGDLDAFFFVAGPPTAIIARLMETTEIRILPIVGRTALKLVQDIPFLQQGLIGENLYSGIAAVPTLTVGSMLLVREDMPEDLAYQLARALWHPNNLRLYGRSHPSAAQMSPKQAVTATGIPLHPGAERYYVEAGLLPAR
ncbi:TAXI family TRAP transporter solute-binding subunit [Novispirillum itersonii]|uniref:Immunogenic protein n=1 Tax=Novispirillum itersonii TaxID=189 RepID=A0A7W9ZCW7_NOVIT|nr:TAXI family TRAP transporter solute-binding subunit [Novispirillum itersonii]MBB6209167.1 hypothetical protein [Novispirillum itersonii]